MKQRSGIGWRMEPPGWMEPKPVSSQLGRPLALYPDHYCILGLAGLSKTLWKSPLSNILVLGLICRPG